MTSVNPCVGETWYYLMPNAVSCSKGQIVDITQNIVSFKRESWSFSDPIVYPRKNIEFIERVSAQNSNYMCDND